MQNFPIFFLFQTCLDWIFTFKSNLILSFKSFLSQFFLVFKKKSNPKKIKSRIPIIAKEYREMFDLFYLSHLYPAVGGPWWVCIQRDRGHEGSGPVAVPATTGGLVEILSIDYPCERTSEFEIHPHFVAVTLDASICKKNFFFFQKPIFRSFFSKSIFQNHFTKKIQKKLSSKFHHKFLPNISWHNVWSQTIWKKTKNETRKFFKFMNKMKIMYEKILFVYCNITLNS